MIPIGLGLIVVEVCESNSMARLPLEELEEEYPEVAVLRNDCFNMCLLCAAKPFALVNRKRVVAKTTDECLAKIKAAIEKEIKEFYEG